MSETYPGWMNFERERVINSVCRLMTEDGCRDVSEALAVIFCNDHFFQAHPLDYLTNLYDEGLLQLVESGDSRVRLLAPWMYD